MAWDLRPGRRDRDSRIQAFAFDEFHDEEVAARNRLEGMDGGDAGMIQGRQRFRLPLEPGDPLAVLMEVYASCHL